MYCNMWGGGTHMYCNMYGFYNGCCGYGEIRTHPMADSRYLRGECSRLTYKMPVVTRIGFRLLTGGLR